MLRIQAVLTQFKRDERGTSALGYALVAALLTFILIGTVETLGDNLGTTFAGVASSFNAATAKQAATAPSGLACRPLTAGQPTIEQCQQNPSYPGIAG